MSPDDDPADIRGPCHGLLDRIVLLLQLASAWIERALRRKPRGQPGGVAGERVGPQAAS
jgi:hypothetical protein